MFAATLAARLERSGIHYGWVTIGLTLLVTVSTAGAMGLPSVLMLPLQHEFGWTTDQVSSGIGFRILLFGLMAPFAAAMIERYGLRPVILGAVCLLAAATGATLFMTSLWQFIAIWGFLIGLATGMTALVMSAIVASRWFVARRGLVVGILTGSNAAGQFVFLPLAATLERDHGWRIALLPTIGGLALAALLAWLFLAERPSDVGQKPYGVTGPAPTPPTIGAPAISAAIDALREASGSAVFWILAGTFFICGLSTTGLVQAHWIAFCADYGIDSVTAASTLAVIGGFDIVGTILSGWLSDRFDNRALLSWYYGLRGLSLLFIPNTMMSIYGLSAFAAFYGLDWIATVPPTVRLCGKAFGAKGGIVFGWIYAAHMIGGAVAAYGGGFMRFALKSYSPAFLIAGVSCLVASAVIWLIAGPGRAVAAPGGAAAKA